MEVPPDTLSPTRAVWSLDSLEKKLSLPLNGSRPATLLFLYYLTILIALLLIYGRGDFQTAPFVYQGF